jgi:hypothetical protein
MIVFGTLVNLLGLLLGCMRVLYTFTKETHLVLEGTVHNLCNTRAGRAGEREGGYLGSKKRHGECIKNLSKF